MEARQYLNPVKSNLLEQANYSLTRNMMTDIIFADEQFDFDNLTNYSLAIIGIPDNINNSDNTSYQSSDSIREKLCCHASIFSEKRILDLGNLKKGNTPEDTRTAFRHIFSYLLKNDVCLIVLGGSKLISDSIYHSYSELGKSINICSADSRIESMIQNENSSTRNFLTEILSDKKNFLFNYTSIGYQNHYVNQSEIDFLNKLYFNTYRLGQVRADIKETEPEIRDSDYLSFDISCIRQSDAPGNYYPGPSGFFGEEACQIAKYGGMSDRLSCFGLFGLYPDMDNNNQTINLTAQITWYFINGFSLRKKDYPKSSLEHYKKFIVELGQIKHKLVFYKSPESDRWWLEVPSITSNKPGVIVACSYSDYQKACNQEVPDRWLKTYQKIN